MTILPFSLRDLQYVVAVAEHGHFGQAADACAVSQPALSAQIRKLEDSLGVVIFERGGRRVLVTPSGEDIVARARIVLRDAEGLVDLARTKSQPMTGPFALGAIASLGPFYFPRILAPLRRRFPDLVLSLREDLTESLLALLHDGGLDAALVSPPIDETGLESRPIFFEPFEVAAPVGHPVLDQQPIIADTLDRPDLILLEQGHCLRDQTIDVCGLAGSKRREHARAEDPPRPVQATGIETLRHMIGAGAGFSLLPSLAVRDMTGAEIDVGGLIAYRPFGPPYPGRVISLVWRARSPRAEEIRSMADFLSESIPLGVTSPRDSDITAA